MLPATKPANCDEPHTPQPGQTRRPCKQSTPQAFACWPSRGSQSPGFVQTELSSCKLQEKAQLTVACMCVQKRRLKHSSLTFSQFRDMGARLFSWCEFQDKLCDKLCVYACRRILENMCWPMTLTTLGRCLVCAWSVRCVGCNWADWVD